VRARLIGGGGDAVEIAAQEAGRGALHVDRRVDMEIEDDVGHILDEIGHAIDHALA
jgi:hypothetical protein